MKSNRSSLLFLSTMGLVSFAMAQGPEGKPPPPPPGPPPQGEPGMPHRDGDRGGPPRGEGKGEWRHSGGPGRGPGGFGKGGDLDFSKLSEAERNMVRQALESAWKDPEVVSARERMTKAHDDFRNAITAAVTRTNPEAAKLLSKIRPPSPWDMSRDKGRLPPPEDPKFAEIAIGRLSMELFNLAKPEHRDAARKMHDRVMALPSLVEASQKLRDAPVPERIERFKSLAEEYKRQIESEFALIRAKMRNAQPPLSGGAPPPPGKAPTSPP